MPELRASIHATGPRQYGVAERGTLALVNKARLRRILSRMFDENEFLSPFGIRALSRYHAEHPYVFWVHGPEYRLDYLRAESDTGMFGGNSNWRGPIWVPVNALLIRALLQYYLYYGDNFKIECPTGSGNLLNLFEVAREIANRLTRIFLLDPGGRCSAELRSSRATRTGGIICCSTNISTATTALASAPVIIQDGPDWWRP
jgi:Glycosyl hydrolase family 63 C-terminal domain